jgi:hypothetical protein
MTHELMLNGINADGSTYADELEITITPELIANVARGQKLTPEELQDIKRRRLMDERSSAHLGVAEGIDATKLDEAGWGVVFPSDLPQTSVDALKDALKPLLEHRQAQAAATKEHYYREFIGEDGYRANESKNDFLKRFGRGPGPADPEKVPYYLLLVGSPESIPFSLQYQLDVQYAVGRIHFETLEEYHQYAQSVVRAETQGFSRGKNAAFFGVSHPGDRATQMSAEHLVLPLAQHVQNTHPDWSLKNIDPAQTTKSMLAGCMGGSDTPSLLFTASHGMNFKLGDPRQLPHTSALLCQDWPGPAARQPISDKHYFSADDIASDADVFGMIAFFFACYGGGIPKMDNFYRQMTGKPREIAPYSFLAKLPMRLLSHPRGGALAVLAHIDRAWGASILWDGTTQEITTFQSTLDALLEGKPAGVATEYFNERYAEISTDLVAELDSTTPEFQDEVKLAGMWTANNDARNYALLGDPAVRLAIGMDATLEMERPTIRLIESAFSVPMPAPEPESAHAGLLSAFVEDELVVEFGVDAAGTSPAADLSHQLELFLADESIPAALRAQAAQLLENLRNYLAK